MGCLIFYTAYQEWFSWVALLAMLWLPWFSLVVSLPAMLGLRVEVQGPGFVDQGDRAEVWLRGRSNWPVPPFKGRLRLVRGPSVQQWRLKAGGPASTDHCGCLTVTPERVWVYDYLGLIAIPVGRKTGRTLIIRPHEVKMDHPKDLDRFLARSWRPKPGGGYAENHELRLYRPGDNLNQVHWKLTAKTGKLILREPMQPVRGLMLLTMNLRGTPEELDRKFGRLLFLGRYLLERELTFQVRALTAQGVYTKTIISREDLDRCVDELLCRPAAGEGDLRQGEFGASWQCHIGGEPDEA